MSCQSDVKEWTPAHELVTALAMICLFEPAEKQALLEAETPEDRARLMMTLVDLAIQKPAGSDSESGTLLH